MTARECDQFKELAERFFQLNPSRVSDHILRAVKELADVYCKPVWSIPHIKSRLNSINTAIESLGNPNYSNETPFQYLIRDMEEQYDFKGMEITVNMRHCYPGVAEYDISHRYDKIYPTRLTHTVYYNKDKQTMRYVGWCDEEGNKFVCSDAVTYDIVLAIIADYHSN
jgi:hypothetical protein